MASRATVSSNEAFEKQIAPQFMMGKGKVTPAQKAILVGKPLQVSANGTLHDCHLVYGWYDSAWAFSTDGKQFDFSWEEVSTAIKNNLPLGIPWPLTSRAAIDC